MRRPAQPAPDWEGCLAGKRRGIARTGEGFFPPGPAARISGLYLWVRLFWRACHQKS